MRHTPYPVVMINPNTRQITTAMMARHLRIALGPDYAVTALTAERGPEMITEPLALAAAAEVVVEQITRYVEQHPETAGIVVAAMGDPGRAALAEKLSCPVLGIGQCAIVQAAGAQTPFGIATTTPELQGSLEELVAESGAARWCVEIAVSSADPLALAAHPQAQDEALAAAIKCCQDAGAEQVIIGGGPLSDSAQRLAASSGVTIIQPLIAAAEKLKTLMPD